MITGNGHVLQVVIDAAALRWQDRALCGETGPHLFFPPRSGDAPHFTAAAKAICARCPVTGECLEYALDCEAQPDTAGRHGIWGGKTTDERDAIAESREQGAAA